MVDFKFLFKLKVLLKVYTQGLYTRFIHKVDTKVYTKGLYKGSIQGLYKVYIQVLHRGLYTGFIQGLHIGKNKIANAVYKRESDGSPFGEFDVDF